MTYAEQQEIPFEGKEKEIKEITNRITFENRFKILEWMKSCPGFCTNMKITAWNLREIVKNETGILASYDAIRQLRAMAYPETKRAPRYPSPKKESNGNGHGNLEEMQLRLRRAESLIAHLAKELGIEKQYPFIAVAEHLTT